MKTLKSLARKPRNVKKNNLTAVERTAYALGQRTFKGRNYTFPKAK